MRLIFAAVVAVLPSAAVAATYAADSRDCSLSGPLNAVVVAPDGLYDGEMFCPTREWRLTKSGYVSLCVVDTTPKKISFSLKSQPDGSVLFVEKGYSVTLRRCQ